MSPTSRTLAWLRERGYVCQIVERWNPHARVRQDLFGWCDIVAVGMDVREAAGEAYVFPGTFIIGLQVCAGASHAARVSKCKELVGSWKQGSGLAYVVSWSKRGERGKRKLWTPRIELL